NPQTYFHLAHYLHQTIREDHSATLALLHAAAPTGPWYEDWLELSRFGPVLGQRTTLSRYFTDVIAGEYAPAPSADEFHGDYLEERTNAHHEQPVSWFALHIRLRRRLETVWTLAGLHRGLAGRSDVFADAHYSISARLAELEDKIESGINPDPALTDIERELAGALANRLVARAESERAGYMVLNPCSFARRVALELEGV